MNREKKQYLIWTSIAGVLFLVVGVHDVYFRAAEDKSTFVIILGFVAGIGFLLNALLQWRKSRRDDTQ